MSTSFPTVLAAAEAGDAAAQFQLGNIFQQGFHGQTPDIDQALQWYGLAAAQGHRDAAFNVGLVCLRVLPSMNRAPRPDLALPALRQACRDGDHDACCLLAQSMITGDGGVKPDPERGARLLEQVARRGSTRAMNLIGDYLIEGEHLDANPRRANAWFQRAAKAGDASGNFKLGVNLLDGIGVDADPALARKFFLAAAEAGMPDAMHNYAALLINGEGGETDPAGGNAWLLEAAEAGYADAQYGLGQALRIGRGLEVDEAAAVHWYREAAHQDHADALYCLGLCLQGGHGVAMDEAAAEQCYQRAAMSGHGGAAHNLGIMYVRGEVVEQNIDLARELFEYAISCSDDDALFSMGLLCANSGYPADACLWALLSMQFQPEGQGQALLDHVAPQLTAEQVSEARAQASRWQRPQKTMAFWVQRRTG